MSTRRRWFCGLGVVLSGAAALAAWYGRDTSPAETERLAIILEWKTGRVIAEIGAGNGEMTVAAAERVGPSGHVFSTELDPKRLADIQKTAAQRHLTNITAVKAGEADSNLPAACCDAVFMRDVYHHFTHPAEIDATLFRAVRPGGLLAVIDFPPKLWLSIIAPVNGAPTSHGGHGVPQAVLIQELTAAGFQMRELVNDWPGHTYCIVFGKPPG